jgi:hypothetical protein
MSSKKKVVTKKSNKISVSINPEAVAELKRALNQEEDTIQRLEDENATLRDFIEMQLGINLWDNEPLVF